MLDIDIVLIVLLGAALTMKDHVMRNYAVYGLVALLVYKFINLKTKARSEGMTNVGINNEALQSLASMYNNERIHANNLNVSNNLCLGDSCVNEEEWNQALAPSVPQQEAEFNRITAENSLCVGGSCVGPAQWAQMQEEDEPIPMDPTFNKVTTNSLCLGEECVDQEEWQAMSSGEFQMPTDLTGRDITSSNILSGKNLALTGNATVAGNTTFNGEATFNNKVHGSNAGVFDVQDKVVSRNHMYAKKNLYVEGAGTVNGPLYPKDNVFITKNANVGQTLNVQGAMTGTSGSFTGPLTGNKLCIGDACADATTWATMMSPTTELPTKPSFTTVTTSGNIESGGDVKAGKSICIGSKCITSIDIDRIHKLTTDGIDIMNGNKDFKLRGMAGDKRYIRTYNKSSSVNGTTLDTDYSDFRIT